MPPGFGFPPTVVDKPPKTGHNVRYKGITVGKSPGDVRRENYGKRNQKTLFENWFCLSGRTIVIYAIQFLAAMVGKKFVPGVMADANGSFIVLMLTMYGISMPFMGWLVSRIPTQKIEERKMTADSGS